MVGKIYSPEEMRLKIMRLQSGLIRDLVQPMTDACEIVEGKAKKNCTPGQSPYYRAPYSDDNDPRREPPHMRDTIEGKIGDVTEKSIQGIIHTPKDYSLHVHEGTSRMKARPFILDAIQEEKETVIEILEMGVRDHIRRECVY